MTSTRIRAALYLALLTASVAACAPPAARGLHNEVRPNDDPLQRVNRKVFWFNDQVDEHVLEPVARGWHWIAPAPVERSVANFFVNVRSPIVVANDLLQGKPKNAASDVARFVVNTTVGVAGFFDYATPLGLPQHVEDFGQTLGWWGLPAGPYLVLPLLGPSNPRDVVGLIADSAANIPAWFLDWWILVPPRVAEAVNTRALLLRQVDEAKRASFDYYVFLRDAYAQRRNALVNDRTEGTNIDQEELYYPQVDVPAQSTQ